jgi:hypothetical protein
MKKFLRFKLIIIIAIVSMTIISIPVVIAATTGPKTIAAPTKMKYFVTPHQDDEFEMWSQVENDPSSYKVFIYPSRGEQTAFCDPQGYLAGYQAGLEFPAGVTPTGLYTASCEQSRNDSMIRYFTDMSDSDPTIPGRLVYKGKTGQFPTNGVDICRKDSSPTVNGPCTTRDTSAEVWVDALNRGAVVVFNVGEGDQTQPEVTWAIQTVLNSRVALGLNSTLPNDLLLGGYFNNVAGNGCAFYDNADHLAVHRAIRYVRYNVREQGAAGCAVNPDMTIKPGTAAGQGTVEPSNVESAFQIGTNGERIGAHVANYGWLHQTYYDVSRNDQTSIFMAPQSFWTVK